MVDNIFELINSRTKREPLWKNFMEHKYSAGRLHFKEAISIVENFIKANNINIQSKFERLA